jgi:hypothetical protein
MDAMITSATAPGPGPRAWSALLPYLIEKKELPCLYIFSIQADKRYLLVLYRF